jgi:hypothetical protein
MMDWMQDPFHVGLESQQEAYMRKVSFCLHIRSDPGFQLMSNMITRVDKCGGGNGMMMDPYPCDPQHLMVVVKHELFVWSGCGTNSMWVLSL